MRRVTWQLGRPYINRPFHSGLPTPRDWLWLFFGLVLLAAALSHWIIIGEHECWRTGVSAFASEAFKELKEYGK